MHVRIFFFFFSSFGYYLLDRQFDLLGYLLSVKPMALVSKLVGFDFDNFVLEEMQIVFVPRDQLLMMSIAQSIKNARFFFFKKKRKLTKLVSCFNGKAGGTFLLRGSLLFT